MAEKIKVADHLVQEMHEAELKFKHASDKFNHVRLDNLATGSAMASAESKLLLTMDILADIYITIMEVYGKPRI